MPPKRDAVSPEHSHLAITELLGSAEIRAASKTELEQIYAHDPVTLAVVRATVRLRLLNGAKHKDGLGRAA